MTATIVSLYRVSQQEGSIFWEVIVSAILSTVHCTDEKHAMFSQELQKYINVDGGILENVLFKVNCTKIVT
jgi:hypothetical protein